MWAKGWLQRGYAVAVVDGSAGTDGFDATGGDEHEHWIYRTVARTIRARTALGRREGVNATAIGVTGIGKGGVVSCLAASVDSRFAFAVPVYACGFLRDHSTLLEDCRRNGTDLAWTECWDPSSYLPQARCPFLWLNGSSTVEAPIDSLAKSAALVKDSVLSVIMRKYNQHVSGMDSPEIFAFADHVARGGRDVVRFLSLDKVGDEVFVRFDAGGRKIARAEVIWTPHMDLDWKDRWFRPQEIKDFNASLGVLKATVNPSASLWYVSLTTDEGLVFATPVQGPSLVEFANGPRTAPTGPDVLPGEPCFKAALPPHPFPDRLSAFVWRNWGLVPVERMAKVIGAAQDDLRAVAVEMGLAADPIVLPEWRRKGYITVTRRNWHLLPYDQLVELLDMTRQEFRFYLMEDDFLWVKLGRFKPICERLQWNGEQAAKSRAARQRIAAMLKEEGLDPQDPEEPRFTFVKDIAATVPRTPESTSDSPFDFRLIFSYFADFADPLADPAISSFPEGLLQRLSEQGVNAVWLHTVLRTLVKDPKYPEFGEGAENRLANLRKLVERCRAYGIKVYLYMNEPRGLTDDFFAKDPDREALRGVREGIYNAMCTSSPETLRWLHDSLKTLFSTVHGLGGIFTITMSENLTSCASRYRKHECPRCCDRSIASIVSEVNRTMIAGMMAGDPSANALVWNWGWPEDACEEIVRGLPKGNCRLMAVSERGIEICRGGVKSVESDYSLSIIGPGDQAKRFWRTAKAADLPVVAKVQASASWELGSFPYLPVMDLVAEHAANLSAEGVNGVMLSWSVGGYPSSNLSVYRDFVRGPDAKNRTLDRIAQALYGEKAQQARRAWTAFSEGFRHYPFDVSVLYEGPQHMGVANPLYAEKTGYAAGMVCYPYDAYRTYCGAYPPNVYAELIGKVADGFAEGCHLMEGVVSNKELDLYRAEQMHFASCRDQVLFYLARDRGDHPVMREILLRELARAKAYWPLVRADSRIGYESSNQYFLVPRDVLEKVLVCRLALEPEVRLPQSEFNVSEDYPDAPCRTYETTFVRPAWKRVELDLGEVHSLAEVSVNGRPAGVFWCEPYACDVTPFLRDGTNRLEVKVVSGWRNRLIRDAGLSEDERRTWTTPMLKPDEPRAAAGLYGPVRLVEGKENGSRPHRIETARRNRPETWFHLIGGNVSQEGLTADLEAIRAAGIGGIQFFHGQFGGPWPGVPEQIPCLSEKWDGMVRHVGLECRRLGLDLKLQNCPGWSMSGGPWIDDAHAMRKLVMNGKGRDYRSLCRMDIPETGKVEVPISCTTNGDERTYAFSSPVALRTLVLPSAQRYNHDYCYEPGLSVRLESRAGTNWVCALDRPFPVSNYSDWETQTFAFDAVTGQVWRLTVRHEHPIAPRRPLEDPVFSSAVRLDNWEGKAGWTLREVGRQGREDKGTSCETVPVEFGHVNPEITNHPAPPEATGWECDKLDPHGIEANFAGYVGRLLDGPLNGLPVKGLVIDSWECGAPTWTWRMPEYFRELNGYGLERWLPALFGHVVESVPATEGFLRDWRRTQGELVARNYYGKFAELAHARGLEVQYETSCGDVIAGDILSYWKHADTPMCEFWSPHADASGFVTSYDFKPVRPCVSAAHVYGKRRVAAEAFTSFRLNWDESLRSLKRDADKHYARGVTHLVFHTYTHNPRVGLKGPGSAFGRGIGTPFMRGQSWWPYMGELTGYFARCNALLERGKPVVDVLWYLGDDCAHKPDEKAPFPSGYKYDYCTFDALSTRASVADGRIAFPDGMSYGVLWVPVGCCLRPETERCLAKLEKAGARIVRGSLASLTASLCGADVVRSSVAGESLDDFMWYHREDGDSDIYFLATSSADGYHGQVKVRSKGHASLYDPVRQTIRPFDGTLDLPPDGSAFLFVERGPLQEVCREQLPRPVFDEKPELVELYDKAWEIAHTRIDNVPGIPVPRYMDEGHRSDWIWIWDTCFMAHFCKYAPWEFPGIDSLGNFYGLMFPEGELKLPKVIGNRWSCGPSGIDDPWEGKLLDFKLALPDNPPLFAWTEYRHALQTGDRGRLERIYREKRYLQRWFELFENFTPEDPPRTGVLATPHLRREGDLGYHWDGGRSGMDNTPRGRKGEKDLGPKSPADCPNNPDLLWVDAYSQQALAALYISRIADLLGDADGSTDWRAKYEAKKAKINELYWDEMDGFYYDILASDRSKCKVPTMASYWTLLAEIPDAARRARLVEKLKDESWFGGAVPTPSLARKDADFWPTGGYWRGGVWMPTTYMVMKALDGCGETALARDIARKVVFDMCETWRTFEPHTIWECYSPTEAKPSTYAKNSCYVRDNFCGWSALGPISLFIEDVIGVKEANAFTNTLVCDFERNPKGRVGVENYRFCDVICSVVATTDEIRVKSNKSFILLADGRKFTVSIGEQSFARICSPGANDVSCSDTVGGL